MSFRCPQSTVQNRKLKSEKKRTKNKNSHAQKKRCQARNHGVSPVGVKTAGDRRRVEWTAGDTAGQQGTL